MKLVQVSNVNKSMTTEIRKINQTWSIPYLEEANFSSSQSLRLLVSVYVSNSNLSDASEKSRHHVGGMSFGVKKILRDSEVSVCEKFIITITTTKNRMRFLMSRFDVFNQIFVSSFFTLISFRSFHFILLLL